jgi:hypothetical protein
MWNIDIDYVYIYNLRICGIKKVELLGIFPATKAWQMDQDPCHDGTGGYPFLDKSTRTIMNRY